MPVSIECAYDKTMLCTPRHVLHQPQFLIPAPCEIDRISKDFRLTNWSLTCVRLRNHFGSLAMSHSIGCNCVLRQGSVRVVSFGGRVYKEQHLSTIQKRPGYVPRSPVHHSTKDGSSSSPLLQVSKCPQEVDHGEERDRERESALGIRCRWSHGAARSARRALSGEQPFHCAPSGEKGRRRGVAVRSCCYRVRDGSAPRY